MDTIKLEAELGRLIAESERLRAEQDKFNTEQARRYAEASNLTREGILYPLVALATSAGAVVGIGTIMLKLLGKL